MQVVDFQARKKGIRKVPFSLNGGERGYVYLIFAENRYFCHFRFGEGKK